MQSRQSRFRLGRRTLLRGMGGAAAGLPFLEIMAGDRQAAAAEARYFAVLYGGVSLGSSRELITPATAGADYEVTRGLRPLLGNSANDGQRMTFPYPSVREEFSLVSGLKVPWEKSLPAHRSGFWHCCTHAPVLAGTSNDNPKFDATLRGPTSDFLVHRAIGGTKLHLKYRAQAVGYQFGDEGALGRASASLVGGNVSSTIPVSNPAQAHRELFQSFKPQDEDNAVWQAAWDQKKSVIDLVRRNADRLQQRLGTSDRQRLERHFEEIRALEARIHAIAATPMGGQSSCNKPADPAVPSRTGEAWSDEETRAKAMTELVYLAFACDLARSASLMYTFTSSYMTARYITASGRRTDVHQTGHAGNPPEDMADCYAWHLKHVAHLVHKLKSTPTPTGTLLDQAAVVFLTEAGCGKDPAGTTDGAGSHSSQNMLALLAGRAGGHKPGRHFKMGNRVHPASVTISAMRMVGVMEPLGEIESHVGEVFT